MTPDQPCPRPTGGVGSDSPTLRRRGRPRVLTSDIVRDVARLRDIGIPYSEISVTLGLEVGTARYACWLNRHGVALSPARLEIADNCGPTTESSRSVSTDVSREDCA